jgi:hypothetical protein
MEDGSLARGSTADMADRICHRRGQPDRGKGLKHFQEVFSNNLGVCQKSLPVKRYLYFCITHPAACRIDHHGSFAGRPWRIRAHRILEHSTFFFLFQLPLSFPPQTRGAIVSTFGAVGTQTEAGGRVAQPSSTLASLMASRSVLALKARQLAQWALPAGRASAATLQPAAAAAVLAVGAAVHAAGPELAVRAG